MNSWFIQIEDHFTNTLSNPRPSLISAMGLHVTGYQLRIVLQCTGFLTPCAF